VLFSKLDNYKVHLYKKKKNPIYPVTPLLANFVEQHLPQNQPPWHNMLAITGLSSQFWLCSGIGASLAHATTKLKPRSSFSPWKKSCHSHPFSAARMMINHTLMNPPLS
jgi:hypothetical protein